MGWYKYRMLTFLSLAADLGGAAAWALRLPGELGGAYVVVSGNEHGGNMCSGGGDGG